VVVAADESAGEGFAGFAVGELAVIQGRRLQIRSG
jgi:hypothetical protein